MNTFSHVPPGFRFHPTDEELVDYYLRKKVASKKIDLDVIKDVDLYKIEPWDLQELCKIGSDEQSDWYFFSHKDKKYPTGSRTNRATKAGFWKATGRDKAIYSKHCLVGMRKTLVFYQGRAPNGHKSDWIMHEYRLETNENRTPPEEGWVVCRVFKKRMTAVRKMGDYYESPSCTSNWYEEQVSFMPDLHSPSPYPKLELQYYSTNLPHHDAPSSFLTLPQLQSPSTQEEQHLLNAVQQHSSNNEVTDWRVLDKFVASQLSHDQDVVSNKENSATTYSHNDNASVFEHIALLANGSRTEQDYASTSTSSSQIDLWK